MAMETGAVINIKKPEVPFRNRCATSSRSFRDAARSPIAAVRGLSNFGYDNLVVDISGPSSPFVMKPHLR